MIINLVRQKEQDLNQKQKRVHFRENEYSIAEPKIKRSHSIPTHTAFEEEKVPINKLTPAIRPSSCHSDQAPSEDSQNSRSRRRRDNSAQANYYTTHQEPRKSRVQNALPNQLKLLQRKESPRDSDAGSNQKSQLSTIQEMV